jgi:hypothetical protein
MRADGKKGSNAISAGRALFCIALGPPNRRRFAVAKV